MNDTTTLSRQLPEARRLLNKVPEVTIWFWVIKILCTTVGESFADWINMQLGVGLVNTAWIFTAVFALTLTWQMTRARYVPFVYWLTVVVVSVTGTLYTDILTDEKGVPLWVSSSVFAALLAVVFGVWYAREGTLSIHSITTSGREGFYWLAVLVTFALGTATGDWTLDLTGWSPGVAILLPLSLIAIITGLWKYGMNPVLAFWLAYILTRPLGANIGDFLGLSKAEKGLGLGTFATSLIFLAAILLTVVYLSITRSDVVENRAEAAALEQTPSRGAGREKVAAAIMAVVAVATAGLLTWAHAQPHVTPAAEGAAPSCASGAPLTQQQATVQVARSFPQASVDHYRTIVTDTLAMVQKGDQSGAAVRITDLETAWDADQGTLQPMNCQAWTHVDAQIDPVLSSVRASTPDPAQEVKAIDALMATLG